MKQQSGLVIKVDDGSAQVKLFNDDKKKIIEVNNKIGAEEGQTVIIKLNTFTKLKFMYIKYIQPILFALIGLIIGEYIGEYLNQPTSIYKWVCVCIFITLALIYKDYTIEKNKLEYRYKPLIIEVIPKDN